MISYPVPREVEHFIVNHANGQQLKMHVECFTQIQHSIPLPPRGLRYWVELLCGDDDRCDYCGRLIRQQRADKRLERDNTPWLSSGFVGV